MSSDNFIIVGFSIPPMILTIIGNAVFFGTLLRTSLLHTPSNFLLGALCVTDLLAGLVCQPIYIAVLLSEPGPCCPPLIQAFNFIYELSCWNSFLCSLLITLDRYSAVCYPYRYREYATCKKYAILTTGIFVSSAVHSIIKLISYKNSQVVFLSLDVSLQLLMIVAVLLMYARIYTVVFSQRKRMSSIGDASMRQQSRVSLRERSRTHTVTMILIVFVACYTPYTVFCVQCILYYEGQMKYSLQLGLWANFLVLLNSCLNPMIYCARSQEIRRAAVKIFNSSSLYGRDSANAAVNAEENGDRRTTQFVSTAQL